jgi:hypothetical protein
MANQYHRRSLGPARAQSDPRGRWFTGSRLGTDHELLFHNGDTGGFRSVVAFVAAHTGVVVLSNSRRSAE